MEVIAPAKQNRYQAEEPVLASALAALAHANVDEDHQHQIDDIESFPQWLA